MLRETALPVSQKFSYLHHGLLERVSISYLKIFANKNAGLSGGRLFFIPFCAFPGH
jgi:hypothetical protein